MHKKRGGGTKRRTEEATTAGPAPRDAPHVRVRSWRAWHRERLRGGACMRAWWVREVVKKKKSETHGAGARFLRDFCKVPVHIYTVRQYIYKNTIYSSNVINSR